MIELLSCRLANQIIRGSDWLVRSERYSGIAPHQNCLVNENQINSMSTCRQKLLGFSTKKIGICHQDSRLMRFDFHTSIDGLSVRILPLLGMGPALPSALCQYLW